MSDNHTYAWDLKWGRMHLGANTEGGLHRRDVKISSLLLYVGNLISSTVLLEQEWSNILWHNWSKPWQDKRITKPSHLVTSASYLLLSAHRCVLSVELNYPVESVNLLCPMAFSSFTVGSLNFHLSRGTQLFSTRAWLSPKGRTRGRTDNLMWESPLILVCYLPDCKKSLCGVIQPGKRTPRSCYPCFRLSCALLVPLSLLRHP